MQIARIKNANVNAAENQDEFLTLPLHVGQYDNGTIFMRSAWTPTPDELAKLIDGANVECEIWAKQHPPIKLSVGEPPEDARPCILNYDWKLNAQANAAALNIIYEYVANNFGSMPSPERILINGPEPVHTTRAIIECLEKFKKSI
jgi:hypothetical protein